jgi:uncharacterized phage protein (predicted DNA packaging)
MLEEVKKHLRIQHGELDSEVELLIDACEQDLKISGVASISESDPLIRRAIIIYSKANFGYDNPDYERQIKAYDLLKSHLAMSGDYESEA